MEHFVPHNAPKEEDKTPNKLQEPLEVSENAVSQVEATDVSHSSPKRPRIDKGLSKSSSVDASDVQHSLSQPSTERPVHQFSNHELPGEHQHRQAVFYEIFAGCAKLSQQMNLVGFESIPVDSSHNKHVPLVPVFILDLTDQQAQSCLKQHINATHPLGIHLALPCGTGSRAREKPLPRALVRQGAKTPQPLRNATHVLGIPGLNPNDQARVASANILAAFVVEILEYAMETGCFVSIENPLNSWMWLVIEHYVKEKKNVRLSQFFQRMISVIFNHCAHGGLRPKQTRFLCSHSHLSSLEAQCPGESDTHVHLPYAIRFDGHKCSFDTAIESEYPELLCKRIARCLKDALSGESTFRSHTNSASTGVRQTKKHASLIPEFHHIVKSKPINKPHKLLTSPDSGGDCGESCKYGVYHSPQQFIKLAQNLIHPFDKQFVIPDILRLNVFNLITKGISFVARVRTESASLINKLARELRFEEARYHAAMPEHAQTVLRGKNILLFKRLLEDNGFEDISAVEMMRGVDLVGTPDKSPLFESKFVPATTTSDYLLASSTWLRKKIQARDVHADDPELSRTLWDTSLAEVDLGFLEGPFTSVADVQRVVDNDNFVCSRRFVIIQGNKPRVIDDLRESCINEAFTIVDRLCLHDIDFVSSMLAFVAKAVNTSGSVSLELQDGRVLTGSLHKDFSTELKWSGKCLDLAKAYKQIPVSASSRRFGVLMLHHPDDKQPRYFITRSLPFGARASVYAFNRISRGLWFLMAKMCHAVLGCFYDDFPIVEPHISSVLATQSVQHLLETLGWLYAKDSSKDLPFAEEFDVLGVRINTSRLHLGVFTLANKPSRVDKVIDLISDIKKLGSIDKKKAQVIHGLLNFMAGFVMGHSVRLACRVFASAISSGSRWNRQQVCRACDFTLDCISNLRSRCVDGRGEKRPVLVFTDAAFEGGVATYGVVIIDPVSSRREVFGGAIPQHLTDFWLQWGSQVIAQAEAFAMLVARIACKPILHSRRVVFFVDNESCRYSCIKSLSDSQSLMRIIQLFHQSSEIDHAIMWIERVPSDSNIADLPSRGFQVQAAEIIAGIVVDAPLDLEATAALCEDLTPLPSFAFGSDDKSSDILHELPGTLFFDE